MAPGPGPRVCRRQSRVSRGAKASGGTGTSPAAGTEATAYAVAEPPYENAQAVTRSQGGAVYGGWKAAGSAVVLGEELAEVNALRDSAFEVSATVRVSGWSPSAAADALDTIEVLVWALGHLGPPAEAALATVRGTMPGARACPGRSSTPGQPAPQPPAAVEVLAASQRLRRRPGPHLLLVVGEALHAVDAVRVFLALRAVRLPGQGFRWRITLGG